MVFKTRGPVEGTLLFLFAQAVSGLFLAIVFALGKLFLHTDCTFLLNFII